MTTPCSLLFFLVERGGYLNSLPTDPEILRRLRISPVSFPRGHPGVKPEICCLLSLPAPSPTPSGLVGTPPARCQSPSVNKALIGCCPVRTGPPEKSNYWLRGFKAAQGRLMKEDKPGTVSRIPAGRPRQPGSRGAAESPRIKGIRRERGGGRTAGPAWPPAGRADLGGGGGRETPDLRPAGDPASAGAYSGLRGREELQKNMVWGSASAFQRKRMRSRDRMINKLELYENGQTLGLATRLGLVEALTYC